MEISLNFTPNSTSVNLQEGPSTTKGTGSSKGVDSNLQVSFTEGAHHHHGVGGESVSIKLDIPGVNLSDVTPAQIDNLVATLSKEFQNIPLQGFLAGSAIMEMAKTAQDFATQLKEGGPEGAAKNKDSNDKFLTSLVKTAGQAENSMYDLVYNSSYPNYSDFLKLMLEVSKDLRQNATNMQLASAQADYNNLMSQSDILKDVATQNYNEAMKNIEADQISGAFAILGGLMSFASPMLGKAGFGSVEVGAPALQGVSKAIDGVGQLAATGPKTDAAADKFKSDTDQAVLKVFEAGEKMIQQSATLAQDLKDNAQKLLDSVLKMLGDLVSAQNQILQGVIH